MSAFWQAFTPKLIIVWREGQLGRSWRRDALAGLTVAIVALPLAMALGIASGASPNQGLVTAVVAGFLISLLGGSRVQVGGPTGAFVVIVAGVIAAHGYAGLVVATLLAGLILIAAGYAGIGRLVRFIPMPVITGFTAGIAVIIASSQVGDFLGLATGKLPADFIPKWAVYLSALGSINAYAIGIGAATLAMILLLRRFAPQLPAFLISLLVASLARVTAFAGRHRGRSIPVHAGGDSCAPHTERIVGVDTATLALRLHDRLSGGSGIAAVRHRRGRHDRIQS